MTKLEQKLKQNSLKIIEKTLLYEVMKMKRKTKEFMPYHKKYHTNLIYCGTVCAQILETLEIYRTKIQEEIIQ